MKTPSVLLLFISLTFYGIISGQNNVKERLAAYRTTSVDGFFPNTGALFQSDSARFYYSENRDIHHVNPYIYNQTTPFDTLQLFFDASYFHYMEWFHADHLYAIFEFPSYYTDIRKYAFDRALIFSDDDGDLDSSAIYRQTYIRNQPVSYTLSYFGEAGEDIWDEFYYEYNANDKLIVAYEIYETEDGNKDTFWSRHYTYKDGLLITFLETKYYADTLTYMYDYVYDAENRFLSQTYTYEEIPVWKKKFVYSGSVINAIYEYEWMGTDWTETGYKFITYTPEGKMSQATDADLYDISNNVLIKYFYNANGKYDSITKYDISTLVPVLISMETFEYDEANRLTFYTYDDDIYNAGSEEYYVDYDYNAEGQIEELNYYNYEGLTNTHDEGFYGKNYTYTYTESGNIDSKSFSYSHEFSPESEINEDSNDEYPAGITWYTIYFYYEPVANDPAGNITGTIYIHTYPSPATNEFTILFGDIQEGTVITTEIFDILGQSMYYEQETAGMNFTKTIDCSTYAPGIYLITASDGINTSWQKVMVR